jgi:hypothetical protein
MKHSPPVPFRVENRWCVHSYYTLCPYAPDGSGRLLLAGADLATNQGEVLILSSEGEVLDREVVLWWTYDDSEIVTYREDRPVAQRSSLVGLPIVASTATMVDASGMKETGRYKHAYGMVPVFRWTGTPDYRAFVTDNIIGLQDAYNKAFSEHLDDVDTDIDALLAINGAAPGEFSRVDPSTGKNQLEALREQGVIVFPDGETRAEFLTRNLPTEKIEYTIKTIRRLIHTAGAVPDLDETLDRLGRAVLAAVAQSDLVDAALERARVLARRGLCAHSVRSAHHGAEVAR